MWYDGLKWEIILHNYMWWNEIKSRKALWEIDEINNHMMSIDVI